MRETSHLGICLIQGGIIQFANPAIAKMAGCPLEQIRGTSVFQWFSETERPRIEEQHRRRLQGDPVPEVFQSHIVNIDGCELDVEVIVNIISLSEDVTACIVIDDITEQKLADRISKLRRTLLMDFHENHDFQKSLHHVLKTTLQLSGMDCGAIYALTEDGSMQKEESIDLAGQDEGLEEAIANVADYSTLFGQDIPRYWPVEGFSPALRGKGFQSVVSFSIGREINRMALIILGSRKLKTIPPLLQSKHQLLMTHLRKLFEYFDYQQANTASEKRYFRLLHSMTGYLYWMEDSAFGKTTFTHHEGSERVCGFTAEELNRMPNHFHPLIPAEDEEIFITSLLECNETHKPVTFEHHLRHKDGTLRWVSNTLVPRIEEDNRIMGFDGMISDITERRQMLEKLQESEEKFQQLANHVDEGFWIYDFRKNDIVFKTPGFTKVLSFSDHTPRWNHAKFLSYILQEDRDAAMEALLNPPANAEFRVFDKDKKIRWIRCRTFPIRDEAGNVIRLAGIAADITQYKEAAEKEHIHQMQLIQADKMSSLGILVSGVAHEINNPNNLIMFNSDILEEIIQDLLPILNEYAESHPETKVGGLSLEAIEKQLPSLFKGITSGSERIKTIVQNLKNFMRSDSGELDQIVHINKVVEDGVMIVENLIKKSTTRFSLELAPEIPELIGNGQQIEQVIINLLTNACQALHNPDKAITVTTLYRSKQKAVEVIVQDEGEGISPENLKRIMDPFFTTKRDTGGTGIGLSVSYSIVEAHQGKLTFESKVNQGTKVTLSLPVKQGGSFV